MKSKFL